MVKKMKSRNLNRHRGYYMFRTNRIIKAMTILLSLIMVLAPSVTLRAADPPDKGRASIKVLPDYVTDESAKSIEMGLKYLVKVQRGNGSWGGSSGTYSSYSYPVVMTSLAGLAFMANGSTPETGPYSRNVSHALNYVLNIAESMMSEDSKKCVIAQGGRSMYGHGFGMLFLAQCYGVERNKKRGLRIKRVLDAAVNLTVTSQSTLRGSQKDAGGWTYSPTSNSDEGSVTVTQLQALRACRNVGITVPAKTIAKTVKYLQYMQNADGGIRYSSQSSGSSRPAVSAAAIACFYAAGVYNRGTKKSESESRMVDRLVNYCKNISDESSGHFFYTSFFKSQGLYQRGGKDWKEYYPGLRKKIVQMQMPDRNWYGDNVGAVYGTSIALVILQLPYGRLPIFQKQK